MKLMIKFNLVFVGVFVVGLVVAGKISYDLLQRNAREEILQNARIMMESALAQRSYTSSQIKPLLETQMKYAFLPQSVPAYAATEAFTALRQKFPEYSYKEAALNPTNPRNRATDWESDIIRQFREGRVKDEVVGERETPTGPSLYLARPLQIKEPGVPHLPQHRGRRAAHAHRPLRERQRVRLADERGDRGAGGVGAHGGPADPRQQRLSDFHAVPHGRVRLHLRGAQPDALDHRHQARHPAGGDGRPGQPRRDRRARLHRPQPRRDRGTRRLVRPDAEEPGKGDGHARSVI